MKINAIIPAGGSSIRYGNKNKLFEPCRDTCVIIESIKPFLEIDEVSKVIIAINEAFKDDFLTQLEYSKIKNSDKIVIAQGGNSRTQSVKNCLSFLDDCDYVLIHDSARPFITKKLILKVIAGAIEKGCALPLVNLTDALVKIDDGIQCVDRANYKGVQTPLCAKKQIVVEAYNNTNKDYLDDLSLILDYKKIDVEIVDGDPENIKITYPKDLNAFLTGIGYDIHRMEKGSGIKLLGVFIPCDYKFIAHSDGDVPIHALMDAILSSIGEKDIGHLFPVDDPKYDDANSIDLLNKVLEIAAYKGYSVNNVSVSIIAEKPILKDYIDAMKESMSRVLKINVQNIGITATTNEKVGALGNCESIASFATVLLNRI